MHDLHHERRHSYHVLLFGGSHFESSHTGGTKLDSVPPGVAQRDHPRQACTMAALTAAARVAFPFPPLLPPPLLLLLLLNDAPLPATSVLLPADLLAPPLLSCCLCTAFVRWLRPEASSICPALARLASALCDEFRLWLWNCSIHSASRSWSWLETGALTARSVACHAKLITWSRRAFISMRKCFLCVFPMPFASCRGIFIIMFPCYEGKASDVAGHDQPLHEAE
jgi:hypothetical protein